MAGLYATYRRGEYVKIRRYWEPWYGADVNDAFAPGSVAVDGRIQFATRLLREGGLREGVGCAVDFGGDRGQLFPAIPADRRVLVDLSDAPPVAGVERVASLRELDATPDLVVAAHVLEHLPRPGDLLDEIREAIATDGHLYVEVPLDRPSLHRWHSRAAYRKWLTLVGGRRSTFVPLDFLSGLARQFGWSVPRLGVVKASEHINYFDADSLGRLLANHRFRVTAMCAEPGARAGRLRLGRLGIVAVPTGSEGS
jgi:hypothetical protein